MPGDSKSTVDFESPVHAQWPLAAGWDPVIVSLVQFQIFSYRFSQEWPRHHANL